MSVPTVDRTAGPTTEPTPEPGTHRRTAYDTRRRSVYDTRRRSVYDEIRVRNLFDLRDSADPAVSEAARADLIVELVPFARQLAHRFNHRGEPLEDLEQVASLGLIKAIDGFRTGEGVAFAAYAHPTILGELRRHFRDKGWMVRVPRSLQERRSEINVAARQLSQSLGRTPTTADIADCLKLSKEQVLHGVQAAQAYSATSLERPFGDDGVTLGDGLVSEENDFELVETREVLRSVLHSLPDRERRILGLRYFRQLSQSEIAKELGISQMHVSRLLRRALDNLRVELVAA